MKEKVLLKDVLFNEEKINYLSSLIEKNYLDFNSKAFKKDILNAFEKLELKERINFICESLYNYLPKNFEKSINIIIKSLPKELDKNKNDGDFGDFILAPFGEYVAKYGCKKEFLNLSFFALEEITKRFSVEFPIRSFFNNFEDETLKQMNIWSLNDNYHLRRLSSEGSRPKLPWGKNIKLDYKKTINILNILYKDKTRYVTRSIANHLNDISKIDSQFVFNLLYKWEKEDLQTKKELDFIIKHSLRNLIKLGDKKALNLIGFEKSNISKLEIISDQKTINLGEKFNFKLEFLSVNQENIIIDYIVYFLNSKNKYSKKVYKIGVYKTKIGEKINIKKSHLFKTMSTRKIYKGIHKIEIQLNGEILNQITFEIL